MPICGQMRKTESLEGGEREDAVSTRPVTCVGRREGLTDRSPVAGDGLDRDVLLDHLHLDRCLQGRLCQEKIQITMAPKAI